jgi:iron complex outermembrane receptor protein
MKYFEKLRNVVITDAFAISSVGVIAEGNNLETIVVGELVEAIETDLVGSIDVLSQEELSYEHVDDTLELFNKVPSVYLARYNQGIINIVFIV